MTRITQLPTWCKVAFIGFTAMVAMRYLAALDSGVGHVVTLRTYLFWALVCAPVAYLADMMFRSVLDYRVVQLVLARVKDQHSSR